MEVCSIFARSTRTRFLRPQYLYSHRIFRYPAIRFHSSTHPMMQKSKESHEERTATEPRESDLHNVILSKVDQVDSRVRIFRLNLPKPTKFLSGQWLDTYVPNVPKAGGFTIISPPAAAEAAQSPYLELAVQDAPLNPAAAWLWRPESEIVGQTLQIRIGGSFVCPPIGGLHNVKKIVLVAGGVGINPLVSMLGYLADAKSGVQVTVLFGNKVSKKAEEVALLDRVLEFYKNDSIQGHVELFLTGSDEIQTGPQDVYGVQVHVNKGRMSTATVAEQVKSLESPESGLVYVCGPPAMTDEIVEALRKPHMKDVICPDNVKLEKWW